MTTQNVKRKDDELPVWIIVGALFTIFLCVIDWVYSSFDEMPRLVVGFLYVMHGIISLLWILSIAKWKDPNYDVVRKGIIALCVMLSLGIGIHHALCAEDKQVIIDSKENAAKP